MKIAEQIIDVEEIITKVLIKVFPDDPTWDIETYDEYCTIIEQTLLCLKQEDEEMKLPTETVVEISELDCCLNDEAEIKDAVVDFLTDEFGFCIKGCAISLEDEGLAKVTNIDWDTEEIKMRTVLCICDFVEDATEYWSKGNYYDILYVDDDGNYVMKHNYGQGIIYSEDFEDYFKED